MSPLWQRMLCCAALWASAWSAVPALAVNLIVLEARGGSLKSGMSIDSSATLTLKEGERLTVIGPDGRSITLKGPLSGQPLSKSSVAADPRQALAALISTRDARTSSIGVVRAGAATAKLPAPWLIDVSRPGVRCLLEGEHPVWWRSDSAAGGGFTLFPMDRSWSAQFNWEAGQDRQAAPALSRYEGSNVFVIRQEEREYAISLALVPSKLDNALILASWMLEKGCAQQADSLIERLRGELNITQ